MVTPIEVKIWVEGKAKSIFWSLGFVFPTGGQKVTTSNFLKGKTGI